MGDPAGITLSSSEAEAVGEALATLRGLWREGYIVPNNYALNVENALRAADPLEREPNAKLTIRAAFDKFGVKLPLTIFD